MALDTIVGALTANQIVLIVSSVVVFGVTLYALRKPKPKNTRNIKENALKPSPEAWKKAGTLTAVMCYPIKSCGGVKMESSDCSILGLRDGFLRDRIFMVINNEGKFVTGRTLPQLTQIQPSFNGSIMTLKAEGMEDITINIADLQNRATSKTSVWDQEVETVDCGNQVAKWLTKALLEGIEPGLRLVYYPKERPTRLVRPKNQVFNKCTSNDVGALSDATSYTLLTQGSINDLNRRLDTPVPARQFRCNFLVDSETPFAEDSWEWVQIGEVLFHNIKPCTRCLFTTVDPDTGIKNKDKEPLKTLEGYRRVVDPKLAVTAGNSPVLGIHLGLIGSGMIHFGDEVFVQ